MSYASKEWTEKFVGCTLKSAKEQGLLGGGGGSGTSYSGPVGTIISFMGKTAPKGYLVCDGAIYNIDDYKELSEFIKTQFGSYGKFGGNGTTTFAVPDLRGEFLRGTGTNGHANQGNGMSVGTHQDATKHVYFGINQNTGDIWVQTRSTNDGVSLYQENEDAFIQTNDKTGRYFNQNGTFAGSGQSHYIAHPTNTSVLYCIKYTSVDEASPAYISYDKYSEKETVVGCWTDGKPIYRKIFKGLTINVGTDFTRMGASVGEVPNFDTLVKYSGYFMYNDTASHPLPWIANIQGATDISYLDFRIAENELFMYNNRTIYANKPFEIILEYTKTTDTEGSFTPEMLIGYDLPKEASDNDVKEVLD